MFNLPGSIPGSLMSQELCGKPICLGLNHTAGRTFTVNVVSFQPCYYLKLMAGQLKEFCDN